MPGFVCFWRFWWIIMKLALDLDILLNEAGWVTFKHFIFIFIFINDFVKLLNMILWFFNDRRPLWWKFLSLYVHKFELFINKHLYLVSITNQCAFLHLLVLKLYNSFLYMRVFNNFWCFLDILGSKTVVLVDNIKVSHFWQQELKMFRQDKITSFFDV